MWRVGQVYVTEGGFDWKGRLLRWAQGSPWTHTFIVSGQDELIEADVFVGVRTASMSERMEQLRRENRAFVILEPQGLSMADRAQVIQAAREFVGYGYAYKEAIRWFLTREFRLECPRHLTCGRLVSEAFLHGIGWQVLEKPVHDGPTPTALLLKSSLAVYDSTLVPGRKYPLRKR